MTRKDQILATMWHKSRQCPVPRTTAEIAEKLDINILDVRAELQRARHDGLILTTRLSDYIHYAHDLTDDGVEYVHHTTRRRAAE